MQSSTVFHVHAFYLPSYAWRLLAMGISYHKLLHLFCLCEQYNISTVMALRLLNSFLYI
jgi:hypothetical protein